MRNEFRVQRARNTILAGLAIIAVSQPAWASGAIGGGGRVGGNQAPSVSDPLYTVGKSIYSGRHKGHRGLRICLKVPEPKSEAEKEVVGTVSLSRKSLRPFKKKHWQGLSNRLVDCSRPASRVSSILERSEMNALIYYLNNRFKLRLKG